MLRQPSWAGALKIVEVDHPATQSAKRERIAKAGLSEPENLIFAQADFEREELGEVLARCGIGPGEPAFFSWLGVTMYLEEAAIQASTAVGFSAEWYDPAPRHNFPGNTTCRETSGMANARTGGPIMKARIAWFLGAALAACLVSSSADAGGLRIGIGVGVPFYSPPCYYNPYYYGPYYPYPYQAYAAPAPVYYPPGYAAPAAVYIPPAQPAPGYAQPAPAQQPYYYPAPAGSATPATPAPPAPQTFVPSPATASAPATSSAPASAVPPPAP